MWATHLLQDPWQGVFYQGRGHALMPASRPPQASWKTCPLTCLARALTPLCLLCSSRPPSAPPLALPPVPHSSRR